MQIIAPRAAINNHPRHCFALVFQWPQEYVGGDNRFPSRNPSTDEPTGHRVKQDMLAVNYDVDRSVAECIVEIGFV